MCCPDLCYTDLMFALDAKDLKIVSTIIKSGRVKEMLPNDTIRLRDIKYGSYGDFDTFFRTHKPPIYFLKGLADILRANEKYEESECVLANVSIAENRILLLVAIYLGAVITFTGVAGPIGYFLGATAAIVGTIYCKHSRSPIDFLSNIIISFDDKVVEKLKCDACTSKIHVIEVQPRESYIISPV